jgi:hypothetical protein
VTRGNGLTELWDMTVWRTSGKRMARAGGDVTGKR